MKFSFNALNHFTDLSDFVSTPDKLSDKLSSSGFEVEGWEQKGFSQLVIAEVKSKKKHPSADRLNLCQVSTGKGPLRSIVCGADNFKEGDKVVLALPGAILPNSVKIQKTKIRGELSEGMLVSLSELGLEETKKGIITLPEYKDKLIGKDFSAHIGFTDTLFDIDITPNRADCLSHFGLSRELSCILDKKPLSTINTLKNQVENTMVFPSDFSLFTKTTFSKTTFAKTTKAPKNISVEVHRKDLCSRYTGQALYGVSIGSSPLSLQVFLHNLGFKPINNIVDITNYCLLQWGQPLHAFDLDRLNGGLHVDMSRNKEVFVTLDHQEVQLSGTELCIRDEKGPVALAGVMGGLNSGIHSDTKNIFMESACFEPSQVRRVSKKLNIETDSSYRFSRSVPSENTLFVLRKSLALAQSLAGGHLGKKEYDIWQKPQSVKPIVIHKKDLERRMGREISFSWFKDKMKQLGCVVSQLKKEGAKVSPPYFRFDLKIKEDLIEEYARLHGYDQIPEKVSYLSSFPKPDQKEYVLSVEGARFLSAQGFYQAINHSFISQQFSDSFLNGKKPGSYSQAVDFLFSWGEKNQFVKVQNPLSAEYDMMRVSLMPSLYKNALQSLKYGSLKGRLFETGKVFNQSQGDKNPYQEDLLLGLMAWGQEGDFWEKNKDRLCIYDLKSAVNSLLDFLHISDYEWIEGKNPPAFMHHKQYMVLKVGGQTRAYIGSLHPFYMEEDKIRVNMALGEMRMDFWPDPAFTRREFEKISSFPVVERDLSFLIPTDFSVGVIIEDIKKIAQPLSCAVQVFDIYENKEIQQAGARSVTFRLTLRSNEKTLTEKEVKNLHNQLIEQLPAQHPIKLRTEDSL